MRNILIVIDMQKDFIDGALGTAEAVQIVEPVVDLMKSYPRENIYATRDTHTPDYLNTQEGKNLPVIHCVEGSEGWRLEPRIEAFIDPDHIYNKPTFGSVELAAAIRQLNDEEPVEILMCGLCTDICVVSNALLLKAYMPEVPISVAEAACAGVTPDRHRAALETMRSCQIEVIGVLPEM